MYKTAGVLAFTGALFLLIRHRPKAGAGVVTLGCVVLLSVTTYSHRLLMDTHRENAELGLTPDEIESLTDELESDTGYSFSEKSWSSAR